MSITKLIALFDGADWSDICTEEEEWYSPYGEPKWCEDTAAGEWFQFFLIAC